MTPAGVSKLSFLYRRTPSSNAAKLASCDWKPNVFRRPWWASKEYIDPDGTPCTAQVSVKSGRKFTIGTQTALSRMTDDVDAGDTLALIRSLALGSTNFDNETWHEGPVTVQSSTVWKPGTLIEGGPIYRDSVRAMHAKNKDWIDRYNERFGIVCRSGLGAEELAWQRKLSQAQRELLLTGSTYLPVMSAPTRPIITSVTAG